MDPKRVATEMLKDDPYLFLHTTRVVKTALWLAEKEGADHETLEIAAWLHDIGRPLEDKTGADHAKEGARLTKEFLATHPKRDSIAYCIGAHRSSAGIKAETLEAQILQDADRLDSLGAIGIGVVFAVGGYNETAPYDLDDPFAERREPSKDFILDEFERKSFKRAEMMNTKTAKKEATRRVKFMREFMAELKKEL